jgi:translation initiation factor IF-3
MVLFTGHEIFILHETLTWAHQAGLDLVEVTNKNHPKEPLVIICHNTSK